MDQPFLDPQKIPALMAGGIGAFLSMLFQRNTDRWTIITTFVTAEVMVYYFAEPLWKVLHANFSWADEGWRGPVALSLGLLSIFFVGGMVNMAKQFWTHPWDSIGKFVGGIVERFMPRK